MYSKLNKELSIEVDYICCFFVYCWFQILIYDKFIRIMNAFKLCLNAHSKFHSEVPHRLSHVS